jgi:hypothetical protein
MALRAISLSPPHTEISSHVRPHPRQKPLDGSITQTLMHGEVRSDINLDQQDGEEGDLCHLLSGTGDIAGLATDVAPG